jgi:single-strand DNA-binding protein
MTSSLNKVTLIGNLGRAPELRYTPQGKAVATLSIATSNRRKNKQTGEWEDETQWHRVTVLDKQAEYAGEKMTKGRTVYVEGSLRYGSYLNKEGVKIPTVEILASHIEPFGAKKTGAQEGGEAGQGEQTPPAMSPENEAWAQEYDLG